MALGFVALLVLQVFFFSAGSKALPRRQGQKQQEQPLGSLSATGEVFVNEKPAPAETTIFAGDTLRTGETATAVFTMSGSGALKIASQTQVVISGDPAFAAELRSGTVVIDSISGPSGMKLRAGRAIVVPTVRSQVTAAKVERRADGSFLVTCLGGRISVISVEGTSGQLLEAGQSVSISPGGELVAQTEVTVKPSASIKHGGLSHTGWTLIGLSGAGAGVAAAAVGHKGGKQSVSPSAP
jgi:ferric-dicitrate binding protein FerR (iron transport regulator)